MNRKEFYEKKDKLTEAYTKRNQFRDWVDNTIYSNASCDPEINTDDAVELRRLFKHITENFVYIKELGDSSPLKYITDLMLTLMTVIARFDDKQVKGMNNWLKGGRNREYYEAMDEFIKLFEPNVQEESIVDGLLESYCDGDKACELYGPALDERLMSMLEHNDDLVLNINELTGQLHSYGVLKDE